MNDTEQHRPPHEWSQWSISDDDLCASCQHCAYQPGDLSACRKGWPAVFDANGYAMSCVEYQEAGR